MKSYMHTNSSLSAPTLRGDALAIYRAYMSGAPIVMRKDRYISETLCLVAERLACDSAAANLRRLGLDADVTQSRDALDESVSVNDVRYVSAGVSILMPNATMHGFDAEAAERIAQRVESGLSVDDAIARTLEQCPRPVLSTHHLNQIEREADAADRRNAREDRALCR